MTPLQAKKKVAQVEVTIAKLELTVSMQRTHIAFLEARAMDTYQSKLLLDTYENCLQTLHTYRQQLLEFL